MGLDYSYEIYVPAGNVVRALTALAEQAAGFNPPLEVTLPGGERLLMPFTSRFKTDPVEWSAGGRLSLDTCIMVDADGVVQEYKGDDDFRDDLGRARIGYVYLTAEYDANLDNRYVSLSFTAATTSMSLLFEKSASVRRAFTDLTAASGGVCCLLDKETEGWELVWLNGEELREPRPIRHYADWQAVVATWS